MHEYAVTQSIVNIAVEAAQQAGARRILGIDLVLGELSSIVDDSIQFYFDMLSQGTLAEGATLRFRREPTTVTCWDCNHQFSARAPLPGACPACAGNRLQVQGGREFELESIEVADDDAPPDRPAGD